MENGQIALELRKHPRVRKLWGLSRLAAGIGTLVGGFMLSNEIPGMLGSVIATALHILGLAMIGVFILYDAEYFIEKK